MSITRSTIKQETNEPLNIYSIIAKLSDIAKRARAGRNDQENCSSLTQYIIEHIKGILHQYPVAERVIGPTEENEHGVSTGTYAPFNYFIKSENGREKLYLPQITRYDAIVTERGINSILPAVAIPHIDLINNHETIKIDLANTRLTVPRLATNVSNLNEAIKTHAKQLKQIIYGQISLARINNPGHTVAFISDSEDVFYIDPQLYNGVTYTGSPIFSDFKTVKYDGINRAYWFDNETEVLEDELSDDSYIDHVSVFQSTVFYLPFGGLAINQQPIKFDTSQTFGYSPVTFFAFKQPYARIIINELKGKRICLGSTSTPQSVANIPPQYSIAEIDTGSTPEAVSCIPEHIKTIIISMASKKAVQALPGRYNEVFITTRSREGSVKGIYDNGNITTVKLMIGTNWYMPPLASLKALGPHVKQVICFDLDNERLEIVNKNIPAHISLYNRNQETGVDMLILRSLLQSSSELTKEGPLAKKQRITN